ncbi:MAG: HAD hydrolase-like protein [Pseudonocardiaceae bacterium]|nr:HAD hydrolase-like protein [Pseudonocardiaceae bacterium]
MGIEATSEAQPRHIVWDWNGTLLDDNHAVVAAVNNVCTAFDRPEITLQEWRSLYSRPLVRCYERLLGRALDEDGWTKLDALYHNEYRELLPTCGLADGAVDLLHGWRAAGGSQSLLSMWFHHELVSLVNEFGLAEVFARIDGLRRETGGGSKAEHLVEHLDAQGLDPAEVVLVGDVVDDARAAEQVGARCVLVSTGVMHHSALEETGAPVADSIGAALRLL